MKSAVIGLIWLVVIGAVILIFRKLIRDAQNKHLDDSPKPEDKGRKQKTKHIPKIPIQDFWDIQDISHGTLLLRPGNRYRAIVLVGSINYQLMSDNEKSQIEVSLINLASSITFPIQIFSMNELCDTTHISKEIMEKRALLPEPLQSYALTMVDGLTTLRYSREVLIRKNYIIVSYDDNVVFDKGVKEVIRRAGTIIDGLSKTGISARLLNSNEIADLMFAALNRQNITKAADIIQEGGLDLYVSGQTQAS